MRKEIPVVVCTAHKGVFFGYIYEDEIDNDPLDIRMCRMCVYWSKDMKGVLGLANMGPSGTCKISAPVPKFRGKGITAVISMIPSAVKKWEAAPWSE